MTPLAVAEAASTVNAPEPELTLTPPVPPVAFVTVMSLASARKTPPPLVAVTLLTAVLSGWLVDIPITDPLTCRSLPAMDPPVVVIVPGAISVTVPAPPLTRPPTVIEFVPPVVTSDTPFPLTAPVVIEPSARTHAWPVPPAAFTDESAAPLVLLMKTPDVLVASIEPTWAASGVTVPPPICPALRVSAPATTGLLPVMVCPLSEMLTAPAPPWTFDRTRSFSVFARYSPPEVVPVNALT